MAHSTSPYPSAQGQLRRGWAILAVTSLGFLLSLFYRVSTAVISPQLAAELSLTSAQLGNLAAAFFYVFAASQIPLGWIMDRAGIRGTMTVLGVVGVAGAVLFGAAHTYQQAWLGRALLGLGMSCNLMGIFALLAAWFPADRFAFLAGLVTALGTLGNLAAATPLALLSQTLGWRGSFWAVAALNLLQVAAMFLVVRDRPPDTPRPAASGKGDWRQALSLFASYHYWAISLSTFVRYGFFVALQGLWAGPFLVYGLGLDPVQAGNGILCLGLGIMCGMPFMGRLSDRWLGTRRGVIWPSLALMGLLVLGMAFWQQGIPLWLIYAWLFILGFAAGPGQIMYAHIKELVPGTLTARAMTWVNLFTMLGGAVFSQLLGWVIGGEPASLHGPAGFRPVWFLGAGCLFLVTILYYLTREPQRPGQE